MNAKPVRSLKKASREDLIQLVHDLTEENEQLKSELADIRADFPEPRLPEPLHAPELIQEIRDLKNSINALRSSFDGFGERRGRSARHSREDFGEATR